MKNTDYAILYWKEKRDYIKWNDDFYNLFNTLGLEK